MTAGSNQRPFRFSAQVSDAASAREWAETARKVEDLGFSSLGLSDHFGHQLAPVPAMMAAAAATANLRLGAFVFDNDYRHPLVLAREAATLDLLSEGRLELGIGAGWMKADYDQSGIAYDRPGIRIDRFVEGLAIVKGVLAGEAFSFSGTHYTVTDHEGWPRSCQRPRPPIIIGGGGRRVLSIAAREADIVSVNADLRHGLGGIEAAPSLTPARTDEKIEWVKEAAGSRFDDIELHVLLGFCAVTDDAHAIADGMASAFGITSEETTHVPVSLFGTVDAMVEELQWRRERWGFSYVSVENGWEQFAPVVARLAGT